VDVKQSRGVLSELFKHLIDVNIASVGTDENGSVAARLVALAREAFEGSLNFKVDEVGGEGAA
jgi:hypothetical protein